MICYDRIFLNLSMSHPLVQIYVRKQKISPAFSSFFVLKKKRKTITREKKTEEGRTKGACVEALF
jgi:hypothetical protein